MCDLVTMEVTKWNKSDGSHVCEAIDTCSHLSQDLVSEMKQARSRIVEEVIHILAMRFCYLLSEAGRHA